MADELIHDEPTIGEGDILCDRYRADRLIERSDMGTVIAATDLIRGGGVAIKMLEPDQQGEESKLLFARLRREAHILSQLTSPHVVRVFDIAMHGASLCVVMELLQGLNLARHLRRRGPLPVQEAVGYVVQACDGLADAHAAGIVHRDIKPQNLFLADRAGGTPIIKVLDFGVSKQYSVSGRSGLTMGGAVLGSPPYSSPEQLRDPSNVDPRADVWSMGLVLYFLLCKRNAFEADTFPQLLIKIATQKPPRLRERRPEVPEALEDIFLQCVQKDPADRFQNMSALAHALSPFAPFWSEAFLPSIDARVGGRGSLPSLPLIPLGPEDDVALPVIVGIPVAPGEGPAAPELLVGPPRVGAAPEILDAPADGEPASAAAEQATSQAEEQAISPAEEQATSLEEQATSLAEEQAPAEDEAVPPAEEQEAAPAEEPGGEPAIERPSMLARSDRRFMLVAAAIGLILVAALVVLVLRRLGHPLWR